MQQDDTVTPNEDQADAVLEEILNPETPEEASSDDDRYLRIKELESALARSQADYQNLLMRVERDKKDLGGYLASKLLLPLLTHVDNLDRAIKLKEWVEWDAFLDGVRSVYTGLIKYLEANDVRSFDSIGEEVNPERHDVMTQMPGAEGKIVGEFEKGYLIGDKVLRHAKVVVGSGN